MGNGLFRRLVQDSNFLWKWSEQSFLREDSFSPGFTLFSARGMAQGGEWSRFNNHRQSFLREDSFSPGYTLSSVGRMGSRLINQDKYSSLLEKNSPDNSSLMFDLLSADALPRSHRCEWNNGRDDSFYIITLFLCRLISDDCYDDCMSLYSRCILLWWMCFIVCDYTSLIKYLCATWCGSVPLDYNCVLLWIDTIFFY
jgi:hypothetical protein